MIDAAKHKEEISRKITFLRKQMGWTQQQVANKIHITRARYDSYEDGRSLPPYRVIRDLCKAHHISMDYFEDLKIVATPCNKISNRP